MTLYEIADRSFAEILGSSYDLAIFASGYEERCTHVPATLLLDHVDRVYLAGFEEHQENNQRLANDRLFAARWQATPTQLRSDEDGPIFGVLRALSAKNVRILVDYSSMSRLWYTAVLNWARFASAADSIIVDLVYSVGEHVGTVPPMVIRDILSLPGLEGRIRRNGQSVAVFGLGFDGLATLCVLDRLEPDLVYAFYSDPAAFSDYPERVLKSNQELVSHHSDRVMPLPLASVEYCYSRLTELVTKHRSEASVTLIPMGPKPHVLAAILASLRLNEVSCLRVSGTRERAETVRPTGDVVCTRVEFRRKPQKS